MITIILSIVVMLGLFLMLIAGVAFIQDKKYFTSAPKDVQDSLLPKEERFKGQHLIGWILMIVSILLIIGSLIYAGYDGIKNDFTYTQFLLRYAVMVLLAKVFDILFFDYYLLCHSNFYPYFYPECKDYVGPHQFGFNKKSHIIQIILLLVLSAIIAYICTLF